MKKYDIFISHSRKYGDNEIANLIYDKLSPYYSVYLDIRTQDLGRFDKLLEEYISKCKDFILIISEDFFERDSWVWQEVKWAMENGKNIIPVYIDANNINEKSFPSGLEDIKKISWVEYHEKRVDDVIRVITKYLKTKSNVKKCKIWSFIWVCSIGLSFLMEFIVYNKLLKEYQELYQYHKEYLIISFFICLFFRTYLKNLVIDIYNYFFIQQKRDISKINKYYCYKYFYFNKNGKKDSILRIIESIESTIILWLLIFVLPLTWLDPFLNLKISFYINLEPICIKTVCVMFSIVFMCMYVEIIFYISVRYWDMNRKHIIITGDKHIQYIENNNEFKQWIWHMCQEDAVFYLENNTHMEKCILRLLQSFIEYNRTMKLRDYVRILNKTHLENINTVNTCRICYIHFIKKDEYWDCKSRKIIGKKQVDGRLLKNYENILIFRSKKQTVKDCFGKAKIKNIDQLSNISQIMETEIFLN